jgi:hypothetical protein
VTRLTFLIRKGAVTTYYNIRERTASTERNEFASLVVALEEAGFIFKCRMEEEFDPETDAIIDR